MCASELSRGLGGPKSRGMTHRCPHTRLCSPETGVRQGRRAGHIPGPQNLSLVGAGPLDGRDTATTVLSGKPCDTDVTQQLSPLIRVLCEWTTAKGARKVPYRLLCCCRVAHGRWTQRLETAPSNRLAAPSADSADSGGLSSGNTSVLEPRPACTPRGLPNNLVMGSWSFTQGGASKGQWVHFPLAGWKAASCSWGAQLGAPFLPGVPAAPSGARPLPTPTTKTAAHLTAL